MITNEADELAHELAEINSKLSLEGASKIVMSDGSQPSPNFIDAVSKAPKATGRFWMKIVDWDGLDSSRRYLQLRGLYQAHPTIPDLFQLSDDYSC